MVYTGLRKIGSLPVAIKISQKKTSRLSWVAVSSKDKVPLEVYILTRCQHPHIIQLVDYFEDQEFIYTITELIGNTGTHDDRLVNREGNSGMPKVHEGLESSFGLAPRDLFE